MRLALPILSLVLSLAWAAAAASAQSEGSRRFEVGVHEGVPWPIVPAPVGPPFPRAPAFDPAPAPATAAAARVMRTLEAIRSSMTEGAYAHTTRVRVAEGVYRWDCSGMVTWVLRRTARVAMGAIRRPRPVARDFVRAIEDAPVGRSRGGWQRLAHLEAVRPGDLFAWRRPRGFPSRNTGHVGFVLHPPRPVPGLPGGYAVRVADATSLGHQDDTRAADPDGGFGHGTLVFLTDGEGHGTHYGWVGTESEAYVVTPIVFGRVTR